MLIINKIFKSRFASRRLETHHKIPGDGAAVGISNHSMLGDR